MRIDVVLRSYWNLGAGGPRTRRPGRQADAWRWAGLGGAVALVAVLGGSGCATQSSAPAIDGHLFAADGVALPPGTPKWLVKPLREAYDKMNADPVFKSTLEKRRLRLMASSGAEIQKAVLDAFAGADPKVVARARKIVFGK